MQNELNMPKSLYKEIKHDIIYKSEKEDPGLNIAGFIEELPLNLQSLVQLEIHKDLFG